MIDMVFLLSKFISKINMDKYQKEKEKEKNTYFLIKLTTFFFNEINSIKKLYFIVWYKVFYTYTFYSIFLIILKNISRKNSSPNYHLMIFKNIFLHKFCFLIFNDLVLYMKSFSYNIKFNEEFGDEGLAPKNSFFTNY